MFKTAFLVLVVFAVAILGGGASVWYALRAQEGVGAVTVAGWTAFPDSGTPEADPYSKARVAREGFLALGRAEGLSFSAHRDSGGEELRRDCAYSIEGVVPSARLWTLYAADQAGAVIGAGGSRPAALQSGQLLRQADDSVVVAASARPRPGNWLTLAGAGPMSFVLTLYDTPVASSTGLSGIAMPQILKVGCDA